MNNLDVFGQPAHDPWRDSQADDPWTKPLHPHPTAPEHAVPDEGLIGLSSAPMQGDGSNSQHTEAPGASTAAQRVAAATLPTLAWIALAVLAPGSLAGLLNNTTGTYTMITAAALTSVAGLMANRRAGTAGTVAVVLIVATIAAAPASLVVAPVVLAAASLTISARTRGGVR